MPTQRTAIPFKPWPHDAQQSECAILVDLHELGRDPMILGKLLKG
jgi:hypothetical protein